MRLIVAWWFAVALLTALTAALQRSGGAARPSFAGRLHNMARVVVECEGESVLVSVGQRTLQRKRGEALEKCLARLGPKPPKKKKGAPAAPPPPPPRLFDAAGAAVDGATELLAAFQQATFLELGDEKLAVVLNPPSVASLDCYAAPTVGRELRAIVAVKHCAPADVAWRWRVGDDVVSEAVVYIPTNTHVGQPVTVEARAPGSDEPTTLAVGAVAARVPRPEHDRRVRQLGPKPTECVRVLTYNVLADAYRHTWDAGIHTHCPPEKTSAEYRVPLAVDEVLDFAPDVVALQEVDAKWFERLWRPRTAGVYDGFLTVKSGKSFEGSALLWKTADWREVDRREVALSRGRDDAAYPEAVLAAPVERLVASKPRLAEALAKIGSVAQLAVLEHTADGRRLVVANTHLFFAGRATHVRVVLLASVLRAAKELKERHGGDVVLCGDLNAEAHDGALRLLLDGTVPADHLDWIIGDTFSWGYASSRKARARAIAAFGGADAGAVDDVDACVAARASEAPVAAALDAFAESQASDAAAERRTRAAASLRKVLREGVEGEDVRAALECGETYKTSPLVALFQLRADAGLRRDDGELALLDEEIPQAEAAIEALYQAAEAAKAEAHEAQRALVAAAEDDPAETPVGAGLRVDSALGALNSAYPEDEPYTNLADGYVATLDWILGDGRFAARQVAELPDLAATQAAHTALPAAPFPSDHVSLVADVSWD